MPWIRRTNTILLSLFVLAIADVLQGTLRAESTAVRGGFGCDRSSEGSVCFADGTCHCGFLIDIEGEIDSTTVDKVRSLFNIRHAHMGEGDEGFNISSLGGDIVSAMAIGRMFRKERAWISTGPNGVCVSACVLILAGAVERPLLGKIGIHRPYIPTTPQSSLTASAIKEAYEHILRDVRAYLREMNVSEQLLDDMLAVEPEKVRYLTKSDLTRYGLTEVDPVEQQTRAIENEVRNIQEANQLGLDRREYTRRKMAQTRLAPI
jgi:ATP-dependent protease ClpP protease subunit